MLGGAPLRPPRHNRSRPAPRASDAVAITPGLRLLRPAYRATLLRPTRRRLTLRFSGGPRSGPSAATGCYTPMRCGNALPELLGKRDDDALGAADVGEPIRVLVLHHFADQFG